jgi:cellulose synthase operon protein C
MTAERDRLIEQLASPDPATRRYAAEDLGDLHDARAVPALMEAVRDPEVAVREAAVDALVAIGGQEVPEHVAPLLQTEDVALRNYAIEILERAGPESIEVLVAACHSDSPEVRKSALDILGKVARGCAGKCLEAVVACLCDANPNVAGSAAEALGRMGDARATPYLTDHLSGPPWMQVCVFAALAQIGGEAALHALNSADVNQMSPFTKHFYDTALKVVKVSVRRP